MDNKKIVHNTLLLYVRQLFVLTIGLISSRLTLKVLGETDFGIYAAVGGVTSLLAVLTTSMATGTQRFITFELGKGDGNKLNRVYITGLQLHLFLALLLLVCGETLGNWFIFNKLTCPPERLWVAFYVFQITLVGSLITLINIPNNAEIIAHEDMGVWAIISIIDVVLRLLAVIWLSFISWDRLLFYAIALFAIQLISQSISFVFCKIRYKEVHFSRCWDWSLMKEMLSVSGWTGLSNLAVTGFIQGVNIILNMFFGPLINAAYTVAMQAYSGIRQFCSSFQLASNPQIVKLYAANDLEDMKKLLYSVCRLSFYLIFILSLPFLLNASFVLDLWLEEVPKHADTFLILLLLFSYSDVLAYPLDVAAQATGKLKKYSISVSIAVISPLIIAFFLYSLGAVPESIYYVAIIVSWLCIFIRVGILRGLIDLELNRFFKEVVLKIIMVSILASLVPFAHSFFSESTPLNVVINFALSFTFSGIIIYLIGTNQREKEIIKSLLFKVLKINKS